jgi:hypothetical protein
MSPPLSSYFAFYTDLATNGILDMEVWERFVIGPRLLKRTANYDKSLPDFISLALLQYIMLQPCLIPCPRRFGH